MYMYIYMYICRHPTYTTSPSPENMWNFPQKNNNISKFSVGKIMISPNCQPIRQFESSQNIRIQVSIEYDIYPDQVCRVNSINATVQQIYFPGEILSGWPKLTWKCKNPSSRSHPWTAFVTFVACEFAPGKMWHNNLTERLSVRTGQSVPTNGEHKIAHTFAFPRDIDKDNYM